MEYLRNILFHLGKFCNSFVIFTLQITIHVLNFYWYQFQIRGKQRIQFTEAQRSFSSYKSKYKICSRLEFQSFQLKILKFSDLILSLDVSQTIPENNNKPSICFDNSLEQFCLKVL